MGRLRKPGPRHFEGWRRPIRPKRSTHADRGFLYEVRLRAFPNRWGQPLPKFYTDLVESLRISGGTRIVFPPTRLNRPAFVRLYLRSEADLMLVRLLTEDDEVFRIYRLVSSARDGTLI